MAGAQSALPLKSLEFAGHALGGFGWGAVGRCDGGEQEPEIETGERKS